METEIFITKNEKQTIELGSKFAERLSDGDVVAFFGELGSGKTEFIKGICDFFEVDEIVTSPTFTIMNQYYGVIHKKEILIYHLDLYRIKDTKELDEFGFSECVNSDTGIKLIEWAEKSNGLLPKQRFVITINIKDNNENERTIMIEKY